MESSVWENRIGKSQYRKEDKMLKKTINYSLVAIGMLSLSACTQNPRVLTVHQNTPRTVSRPAITAPIQQPIVEEEILLGRGTRNEHVASRVTVPQNRPTIAQADDNKTAPKTEENTTPVVRHETMERMPFPVDEYRHLSKRGRSTVSGTVYLENSMTGEKIRGKKIKLWLNPVTSYSQQWYQQSHLGGYKLSKADKRLYNYLKFTYSNGSGEFNFFGLPRGNYYLTGAISCSQECGFNESKTIRLVKEISVGSGVTTVNLMKNVP